MGTKQHTFKGTASWAKVFENNRDTKKFDEESMSFVEDPDGGVYTIDLHMELDEFKKLKKSGSKAPQYSKEDESGLDVVRFKRPHKKYSKSGEFLEWASGKPEVVDEFDEPWDLEEKGWINNGAEVEVTVSVYGTAPMIGTRLDKIKVLQNVERDEEDNMEDKVAF